jgi:CelD/BcsL family acetyltransferase involved in cellulose biosynthesis
MYSEHARYAIRRTIRGFSNKLLAEWAETEEQASDIFADLIRLHQARMQSKGKRGMFSSSRFTAFHKTLISRVFRQGTIILFRVTSPEYGTVGCLYLLVDNGEAFGYQSGFNMFENTLIPGVNTRRLKTGMVTHALCMEECLKRGIRAYNFSTGNDFYKTELSNSEKAMDWVSIRRGWKPGMRDLVIRTYLRADKSKLVRRLLSPVYKKI